MGGSPSNGDLVSESMEGTKRGTLVTPGSVVKLVSQWRSMQSRSASTHVWTVMQSWAVCL